MAWKPRAWTSSRKAGTSSALPSRTRSARPSAPSSRRGRARRSVAFGLLDGVLEALHRLVQAVVDTRALDAFGVQPHGQPGGELVAAGIDVQLSVVIAGSWSSPL